MGAALFGPARTQRSARRRRDRGAHRLPPGQSASDSARHEIRTIRAVRAHRGGAHGIAGCRPGEHRVRRRGAAPQDRFLSRHRRRKDLRLSRIANVACVACVAALFCGPPLAIAVPGDVAGLVDIGDGRAIFVECRGSGSPTVVLMAGKGNGVDDWLQILAPDDPEHDAPGDNLPFGHGDLIHSSEAVLPATARTTSRRRPRRRRSAGSAHGPR